MVPLPVPAGSGALALLSALERALRGDGPVVLPVPAAERSAAGRLVAALGGVLAQDEDDPVDPTALVIATSGSTGEPKGVLLPARAIGASARATLDRLGGPGGWLLALPAWTVAGAQVLARSLVSGTEPRVMDTSAGFRPDGFADAAEPLLARSGRHYTALVPTQLARLVAAGGAGLEALCAFDAVLLGGAALAPALRERAEAAGVRVVTTYGMSETCGGCVYDGRPLDGVRVRLIDVDAGRAGRVVLGGAVVARGYRGQPELTARCFRAGSFHTGDLGRWRGDGRLEVLGRMDDLINTGGVKVAPVSVERALAAQPGVLEVCVVGLPDPEWGEAVAAAVVPADAAAPPSVPELRAAVRDRVGRAAAPRHVVFVPELPLRGPGKVDRDAVRSILTSTS
ncbi:O-succinylbenzoic acid--CoA ligase [Longimycelium tulufanense]|uniref:O-succinylbenzoic acid--CoA ligase n=1 Tax=Longimycelium tulufanense TaxID=907463 RepID=A0A8J3FYA0_9PSEU|nr:O-succinylbenzoic acid--CoA ligase [Longimycelium tulufanense]